MLEAYLLTIVYLFIYLADYLQSVIVSGIINTLRSAFVFPKCFCVAGYTGILRKEMEDESIPLSAILFFTYSLAA